MVDTVNKEVIALFLIAFWLFLPLPMMLFDVGGFSTLETPDTNSSLIFFDYIGFYFNLLVFNIPNCPLIVAWFVRFLQLITVFFIFVMLRGN